jgi:hypothetical protein
MPEKQLPESNGRRLMAEFIDGRGRVKKGIKTRNQGGGVKTLTGISMLEVGWRGVARGGEDRQWRRWHREGDKAEGWGPHGSDVIQRRRHCQNALTQRKDAFW